MAFRKSQHEVRSVSTVEEASGYVRRMVERETRGWGDLEPAQRRIEARYGVPFWSLEHLRTGRAKSVDMGLFQRIRAAYLDTCERQVKTLQHEIAIEKAISGDDLANIETETAALAARIQAAKERMR